MQVFTPYKSPLDCAKALWNDQRRYNKSIIECKQILDAIYYVGKGWLNHPVVKMYRPYHKWLKFYMRCFEEYRKSMKSDNCTDKDGFMLEAEFYSRKADESRPPFMTDELCDQHKRRLYTKSSELYPQFAEYGKSEANYYFVNGELLKYKDGKRIKWF